MAAAQWPQTEEKTSYENFAQSLSFEFKAARPAGKLASFLHFLRAEEDLSYEALSITKFNSDFLRF